MRKLPLPRHVKEAFPTDINRRGVIVGAGGRIDSYSVGIVWKGPQMTVTDRSQDNVNVSFQAINDRGQIVGNQSAGRSRSDTQAVLWTKDNEIALGPWSSADLNEEGIVAGTYYDGSFVNWSHPLVCEPMKDTRYLDIPDGYDFAHAHAINSKQQVVGELEDHVPHAALWEDGNAQALVSDYSQALGINDAGQVVGSMRPEMGDSTAFLWQSGALIKLQDTLPKETKCLLTNANSISASGMIVGSGTQDGKRVGFVLTQRAR